MSTCGIRGSFAIHLGVDDAMLEGFQQEARSSQVSVIGLDLAGLPDCPALVEYLASAFMFPYKVVGLDAAADLISDLDWFGNPSGYLVVARGLADSSAVASSFVSILPNVVDRWRGKAVPFVAAVDGKGEQLQAAVIAANCEMERAGNLPWAQPGTGAVDVVVHGQ